ncbi:MAG: RNA-binding protein [Dehalococcoidales bacterium]|nr:RNA-binding protein [Dehalococcoidales bacterium]
MNIYVGNLAFTVTEAELRQEFSAFGRVMTVSIMNDKYIGSGQPRGYGFVEMASKLEGAAAIAALNGKVLKDQMINVVEALPLSGNNGTVTIANRGYGQFSRRNRQRIRN